MKRLKKLRMVSIEWIGVWSIGHSGKAAMEDVLEEEETANMI